MTDLELIEFLWKLLVDDLVDGDTPSKEDLAKIKTELEARGLESELPS
jgi:hypothetical protein